MNKMATKKMVKKPVMKKGGYLKKKGDGGGWHAPMALPENPKTQSPMVGPMNKPMIGPTNAMRENQRVEQISPADALRKAQELNAINAKKASFQDLKKQQRQHIIPCKLTNATLCGTGNQRTGSGHVHFEGDL